MLYFISMLSTRSRLATFCARVHVSARLRSRVACIVKLRRHQLTLITVARAPGCEGNFFKMIAWNRNATYDVMTPSADVIKCRHHQRCPRCHQSNPQVEMSPYVRKDLTEVTPCRSHELTTFQWTRLKRVIACIKASQVYRASIKNNNSKLKFRQAEV